MHKKALVDWSLETMKLSYKLSHIVLGTAMLMPTLVFAVAQSDTLVQRNIGEVVVVSFATQSVVAPQTLSGIQLRKLTSCSVADAVRFFSGVQIKDYGGVGGLKTVDVRSMGSNHVGIFIDGLQVGNAQNGTVDLGRFSLDNMEEVSVYNGQKNDVCQSAKEYATSASIYLRTLRPVFAESEHWHLKAGGRGGSFATINPFFVFEQKINNKVSLSANAEYLHSDGKYKFEYHKKLQLSDGQIVAAWDTTGVRHNTDVKAVRIESGVYGNAWHLKAYLYDSERGLPCAIVRNVWDSQQRQWDRNVFVQGQYLFTLSNANQIKISSKYSNDYMRYFNPDTTSLYVDNRFRQQAFYLSSAGMVGLGQHVCINLSADYECAWLSSNMSSFASPVRNTLLVALAASVQASRCRMQASLLGNYISDATRQQSRNNRTVKHTPALFFSALIADDIRVRSYFKRMFRMPTFNDLYYTEIGNTSLQPEYATQVDFGVELKHVFSHSYGSIIADAYYNKITNKIVAVPKGNSLYRWMMMNVGKVEVRGAETRWSVQSTWGKLNTNMQLTYTYQKAQDITDPTDNGPRGTYKGQISYIPEHSGSFTCSAEAVGISLFYSFIYVGERYHVSANIPENYEPSWYTHDLMLARSWALKSGGDVRLSAAVNNMLNQQYDVVLNYPMPGRNYKIELKLTI